jgi:integrase
MRAEISSRTATVNKSLKKLAKLAGIESNVTTHVARHTWADMARKEGMNIYDISKSLGHSDINITQIYLAELDQTSSDLAMAMMYNSKRKRISALAAEKGQE